MLQCWKADRGERPSFAQICVVIDRWIRSPETMDDEADFFITIGKYYIIDYPLGESTCIYHFFNIICPERIITIGLVMAACRVGAKVAFRVKI
jgi:hypothetical protein